MAAATLLSGCSRTEGGVSGNSGPDFDTLSVEMLLPEQDFPDVPTGAEWKTWPVQTPPENAAADGDLCQSGFKQSTRRAARTDDTSISTYLVLSRLSAAGYADCMTRPQDDITTESVDLPGLPDGTFGFRESAGRWQGYSVIGETRGVVVIAEVKADRGADDDAAQSDVVTLFDRQVEYLHNSQ